MSKRKQKTAPKILPEVLSKKKSQRKKRDLLRFVFVLVVLISVGGAGFAAFKNNYDISHDLSVIGQGVPAVVQIHDTTCNLCLTLRRNASSAMAKFSDEDLLFRVADVSTPEGQRLMRKYDVSKVTLLLFDRDGKMNLSLNGVKDDDVLHQAFLAHINRRANKARPAKGQPDDV
jgi:hypothetical protein